ncbi:MAG: FecR family protein [Saprospiraceae bacterium]
MLNDEQLHKWVNGNLTKEELDVFQLRPEYDSLVELYKNTESLSVPNLDEEKMLAEILKLKKKKASPEKGRRAFLSNWMKYGVAASLLLLVAWLFWPQNSSVEYNLATGERTEATLPDGSTFVLNAESVLTYNNDTWETSRTLHLEGEAFFEVKKGSKFTVNTPDGLVEVLGTKFNVRARNNTLEVNCQSGKVAVSNENGVVLGELLANDAIRVLENGTIESWKNAPAEKMSWVDGIFSFKNVSLAVVLEELERQYEVNIDASNVDATTKVSTSFDLGSVEIALKTILAPLVISFEKIDEKNIILKK